MISLSTAHHCWPQKACSHMHARRPEAQTLLTSQTGDADWTTFSRGGLRQQQQQQCTKAHHVEGVTLPHTVSVACRAELCGSYIANTYSSSLDHPWAGKWGPRPSSTAVQGQLGQPACQEVPEVDLTVELTCIRPFGMLCGRTLPIILHAPLLRNSLSAKVCCSGKSCHAPVLVN